MMMKITVLLSVIAALFLYSCSGSDSTKTYLLKTGEYDYVLSDSTGRSLVEGVMKLDAISKELTPGGQVVTGSYTITKSANDTNYQGFSSMPGGELKCFYNEKDKFVNINTNPKIADANVFINASVISSELKGSWYYSTFRGKNNEGGLFTAVKRK